MMDIIELRAYASTRQQIDLATDEKYMPKGPMADLVFRITSDLAQERIDARRQKEQSSSG